MMSVEPPSGNAGKKSESAALSAAVHGSAIGAAARSSLSLPLVPPQRYFPWRVTRKLFIANASVLLVSGIGAWLVLTYFSGMFFSTQALSVPEARSAINTVFIVFGFITLVLLAITSGRFASPLGRLVQRARELRRLDPEREEDSLDSERGADDPGEWADLERALNRIHKELKQKTEALSQEREELSALIGAVSDAILAVDRSENPLFYNSPFATLFHTAQKGERAFTLGEMFRSPEVLMGYREVLKTGTMKIVAASLHTSPHALARHFSISIAPLKMGSPEGVAGAIGVFHDVTELKQSEQIRIEFVGNASHELRTPLTSIKGYVDTLREDLKAGRTDGAGQFIDIISRNVDRLIFLVNDLLDLSALESGAELKKTPVSTAEVTEAALKQIENKRAVKRQEIRVQMNATTVNAEPQRLEQVVVNLVHNAIKYVPEGSRIDVIWEMAVSGGGLGAPGTIFRIRDNGPGIPLEHQARIFERFYRVDSGRSREQGGTGLGLAIVKHIMLKHGGSVRLQSRPGEGAEFICFFP